MTDMVKAVMIGWDGAVLQRPLPDVGTAATALRIVPAVLPSLLDLQQLGLRLVLLGTGPAAERTGASARFVAELCASQGLLTETLEHDDTLPLQQILHSYVHESGCQPAEIALVTTHPQALAAARALGLRACGFSTRESDAAGWPALVGELTARQSTIERTTQETRISGHINLDTTAPIAIATGIGFFDHMLEQLAKHGGFSLQLTCTGDLEIDEHHTVEDCALALGDGLKRALGAKLGIGRYGFLLAMDEAEAQVAIDLSGRAYCLFEGKFARESVGGLPTELVPHFYRSLADSLGAAIHVTVRGENAHHMIEASFKGVGRALRQALRRQGNDLPTTKGTL